LTFLFSGEWKPEGQDSVPLWAAMWIQQDTKKYVTLLFDFQDQLGSLSLE
jgi:hypothetical protein